MARFCLTPAWMKAPWKTMRTGKRFKKPLIPQCNLVPVDHSEHTQAWKLGYGISRIVDVFDRKVIDGTVNGLSNAVVGSGDGLSSAQTGYVRDYASYIVIGVVVIMAVFVLMVYYGGGF